MPVAPGGPKGFTVFNGIKSLIKKFLVSFVIYEPTSVPISMSLMVGTALTIYEFIFGIIKYIYYGNIVATLTGRV